MAAQNDFFEDPEFLAALQNLGVTIQPGMAAEAMEELAPLLKADGIDFTDPQANLGADELKQALARATDQRNLFLFTPVGRDRANALVFLHIVTEALQLRTQNVAARMLDRIEPEATERVPAGSHMIGVSLGLLDTWLRGSDAAHDLPSISVLPWPGKAQRIAQDVLALGRKGRAFDSHPSFVLKCGGEQVMHGAVLAVASVVIAVARRDKVPVIQAFEGLQVAAELLQQPPIAHRAIDFRSEDAKELALDLKGEFADWYEEVQWEDDDGPTENEVNDILDSLDELEARALARRLDLHVLGDFVEFLAVVDKMEHEPLQQGAYATLGWYARFRLQDRITGDGWPRAVRLLESRTMTAQAHNLDVLKLAKAAAAEVSPELLQQTIDRSLLMQGTRELIGWLSTPRQVTKRGGIRRTDIAFCAQLIGISAEGVARLPDGARSNPDPSQVIYAQSMTAIPELAYWWIAVLRARVMTLTATRAKLGSMVDRNGEISAATALAVCTAFVAELVGNGLTPDAPLLYSVQSSATIKKLFLCLYEGIDNAELQVDPQANLTIDHTLSFTELAAEIGARRNLVTFQRLGVLELGKDKKIRVAPAFQGAVALGIEQVLDRFIELVAPNS
ncbi:hypothetical protein JOF28_001096 [Leucobacter exalbidus]|uniref:Uncharacterized protein n=1 Tax=Leucobacter exalbidus TaxID=662960 RepID=A0A940PQR9_9MICO|nr:hypothetical protein [Leucobacter exalbidus]MBP1325864.1 hypothetical protein [Leucobacter exalbidus]